MRNLAKKSGGVLERYSFDDSVKWQERLSEYGIVQNEWRTMEELNSNEDGLSKYFSDFKTSDAIIDKLIIPRIEEKQNYAVSNVTTRKDILSRTFLCESRIIENLYGKCRYFRGKNSIYSALLRSTLENSKNPNFSFCFASNKDSWENYIAEIIEAAIP